MTNRRALEKPCPRGKKECPIYDDVARLRRENHELREKVRTDHLTGLYNVRHLHDALDQEIERTKRTRHPTTLIILDLDHFKSVNDTYGHVVGDQALKHIAVIIQDSIRRLDISCRYGGEEFAVILPSTSHLLAVQVAERIRQNVEHSSLTVNGSELRFTVSIGLGTYTHDAGKTAREFIERTDKLLYEAKISGRNRVVFTDTESGSGSVSVEEKAALFDVAERSRTGKRTKTNKPKSKQ